jgi:riboflavin transporter FmnP
MRSERKSSQNLRRMVMTAMFMVLTYVTMLLLRIKVPPFLTLDVKDTIIIMCGLYLGPLSALVVAVMVPALEFFVSDTGFYGLIMNTLGSVTFSVTVALFYKWKKTIFGAVVGLITGALLMTGVMLVANVLITPHYLVLMMHMEMGMAKEMVHSLLAPTLLPFNLLKGFLNVGCVLLLYKPLSRALHKIGALIPTGKVAKASTNNEENSPRLGTKSRFSLTSIIVTATAVVLIAATLLLIFLVLGGKLTFGQS